VQDVFGEDAIFDTDGMMLLDALDQGVNLDELAVRLDRRAQYYETVYSYLFPLLCQKDVLAAGKICWMESLFWRTEEDIRTSLARYGVHLPSIIVNHTARVMFKPEFWNL
jgi:hypothetical protein